MNNINILIADDDAMIRDILSDIVSGMGIKFSTASTAKEVLYEASSEAYDIVLLDLKFPDCTDLSTLKKLKKICPDTDVLLVTAETDDLHIVADAIEIGAFDYVPKPIRKDDIKIRLTRVIQMRKLNESHKSAIKELAQGREIEDIIGKSRFSNTIKKKADEFSRYDIPVLITGETGTGKELVARALHYNGPRRDKPFISINCAALPETLIESELFGHEKGAFTGANYNRSGAFEEASEGTLFLDEIGDLHFQAQAALLRVLESGEFNSVGGKVKKTSARIVLATNQDLEILISENKFRQDLFYRINRINLLLPPLRERSEDIPVLANHFLKIFETKIGKGISSISEDAMEALLKYNWPGNIRELKNEIERAYIYAEDKKIKKINLSLDVISFQVTADEEDEINPCVIEDLYKLIEALKENGGNITKTAKTLNVHRNTVYRWVKKFSLDKE